VHGDIKPRNIRIQHDGRIKVLDFGIAKALRQTRAETRNLYGSVPYSSPERLDRGHVDYHSDLWSVAVVLYEMLEGRPPFRAPGDADVERTIRAGTPAAPLGPGLPAGFSAVLARALAPSLADRYASAQELEADLRAVLSGRPIRLVRRAPTPDAADPDGTRRTAPVVQNGNGNGHGSDHGSDPDATRRTDGVATAPDADATRRSDPDATRRTKPGYAQATEATVAAGTAGTPAPARPAPLVRAPAWLRRVPWRVLLLFVALFVVAREIQSFGSAVDLRSGLASRPRGEAGAVWSDYRRIVRGRVLVHLSGVDGAVRDWMVSHADDLISRYRSDTPTIYESGWRGAESLLERAATIDPGDRQIQARLEYCRGHLLRVAARSAKQPADAMSRYDEAMSRFERATRLWPKWGDPWIGMAQIDAYVKRDPERTAEALGHAREAGYPFGERETALLGDAYRLHAEHLWTAPVDVFDADQRYRHLERIRDDCAHAIEQYELVPSYPGVDKQLRSMRERIAAIDERLNGLSSGSTDPGTFSPLPGTRL
jgi:hypothetical protein